MKILELFSGIGGFAKGFRNAGYKFSEHYFSEIDKHAIANYKYNFPNAKYIGSVESLSRRDITGVDIITFGSPCQDFSLAGNRKGLKGEKSSLISHAIRLVTELRPSLFIWENVKGTFSSNAGADYWAIIQALTHIGGYRLEWQLLNTKWVLPQNRERIYLIGHLDGRSSPRVFPIGEGNEICNQSREAQKKLHENSCASTLTAKGQGGNLTGTFIEVGTWRTFKDGNGFRKLKEVICPTIPARERTDASGCPVIKSDSKIRMFTEIECERLQGFPDDWTKFGNYDGEIREISRTQRYKLIGNAVTVKVVEEIARKINLKF